MLYTTTFRKPLIVMIILFSLRNWIDKDQRTNYVFTMVFHLLLSFHLLEYHKVQTQVRFSSLLYLFYFLQTTWRFTLLLFDWCIVNKLNMNVARCKVCTFRRNIIWIKYQYIWKNLPLSLCQQVKDFGDKFDNTFLFPI